MISRRKRTLVFALLFASLALLPQTTPASTLAACGPGDRPEPELQGRVPQAERLNGNAAAGYSCNLELLGGFRSSSQATFETYGNCAYYSDNKSAFTDSGVIVIDASDPRHPKKTAYLTARAMRWAGESLRVNQARGLLVADHYSPLGLPTPYYANHGYPRSPKNHHALAVYDVSRDCAHPRLLADVIIPSAWGHEGCFQPDGMIYYMSARTITPIDLTDPTNPRPLSDPWQVSAPAPTLTHGCSISDDGTRGYVTDAANSQMLIVDTSAIQARTPGAQPRLIATVPTSAELEQSTVPLSYNGHPYVLLFTEARYLPKVCVPGQPNFGYPRLIDVSDETHPVVASKMQTEVVLPENCSRVAADLTVHTRGMGHGDPFSLGLSAVFGYDSHYCTPDRLQNPTIVACAQLGSGLRVWDVRNPRSPREIAYFNTGTISPSDPRLDWAQARPVIRRDLGQIWWATWYGGFHIAKFRDGVWPFAGDPACPPGYDYFRAQYDLVYQACKA
jgi:hypothetical protein